MTVSSPGVTCSVYQRLGPYTEREGAFYRCPRCGAVVVDGRDSTRWREFHDRWHES